MDPSSEHGAADGGGTPEADPIAREYLLLSLRLGKLMPGLVDAYFGPPELKAQVDAEPQFTPTRLREEASTLEARLDREVVEEDRRRWLHAQLVAIQAQALMLSGDPLPYPDYIACLFDLVPEMTPESVFDAAAEDLVRLLPSGELRSETLADRLAIWNSRFKIAPDKMPVAVDWIVERVREKADRLVGLPTGERIQFDYVSGGPWGAFNRYQGRLHSLVEINTEQLCQPADLIHMAAHDCYPGRHTEHAWKERRLFDDMGRLETGISLVNTPEALVRDGIASVGEKMIASEGVMPGMLIELYGRGGLPIATDPVAAREAAEKQVRIERALGSLRGVVANAAFLLHSHGATREDVLAYLRRYMVGGPGRAERQLALLDDPISRAEVVVASEGEKLLRRWFDLGSVGEQVGRFGRLLREELTPRSIADELASIDIIRDGW